jgi:HYR domain
MRHARTSRAAAAATLALLLAAVPSVFADTASGDTDTIGAGVQATHDLGQAAPGATVTAPLDLVVTCDGTSHVSNGESVKFTLDSVSATAYGSASMPAAAVVGPIVGFPADGQACDSPAQRASAGSSIELIAPTVTGKATYTLMFGATVSDGDTSAIDMGLAFATFTLTVVSNTAPTLHLPSPISVEGNEQNGAAVSWTATATDTEDNPDPTPTCTPGSGSHFALGTTTVSCSAQDTGGLEASGSFTVTVVDTIAPALAGVPSAASATTAGSSAVVTYPAPTATDIVDPHPSVGCTPASGSSFPVGATTVTCTAIDTSGNHSSQSFVVSVHRVQAVFDAPIGPSNVVDANGSRSIPVKVRVTLDGSEVVSGRVALVIAPCGGGSAVRSIDMVWSSDRWTAKLDTTGLGAGCWRASVVVGGSSVGAFDLRVASTSTSAAPVAARARAGKH